MFVWDLVQTLLRSKVSTIHLSSQDDVLVQSLHDWLIEEGDKGGFGIFILHPSIRGLLLEFSGKFASWSTSLGIVVKAHHLEVED